MNITVLKSMGLSNADIKVIMANQTTMYGASIFALFIWIIGIIAMWNIFNKAGERGWKCLIPFYNIYTLCKLTWKPVFFWLQLVLGIFCLGFFGSSRVFTHIGPVLFLISIVALVALCVLSILGNYRISKSFGHGILFTLGLIFLPFVFMLVLSFGKSKYLGNVYLRENR